MNFLRTRLSCAAVLVGCRQGPSCASGASPLLSLAVRALCESSVCFPGLVLAALGLARVEEQLLHPHYSTEGSKSWLGWLRGFLQNLVLLAADALEVRSRHSRHCGLWWTLRESKLLWIEQVVVANEKSPSGHLLTQPECHLQLRLNTCLSADWKSWHGVCCGGEVWRLGTSCPLNLGAPAGNIANLRYILAS